ncbi:BspA family leucine-rich repeat surface protein [Lactobacillus sp. M0403]|uniref:BspA family leucine-rich repeat surface protein n=1 Tax=Lactobacillus sp. M0403 TaxID=2751031 RepID=UPI0018DBB790|nr:BspA family leucine-rich repeat surface protein [Lactobacillus sp. M0403]MBI0092402.1 BspA family leucine-rich repeat surface protein [Lactobacillus sp. M0403]
MKKTNNITGKVLLSSSAAVLLGLISINPQLVKADTFSTSQTASKEETTTSEVPTPSEDIISGPTNTDDPSVSQASPTVQNSDDNVSKKRINGTAAGLQVSYDLDTDELTILGGTYEQIGFWDDRFSDYSLSDSEGNSIKLARAKQIVITGKISLNSSNSASYLFNGFRSVSKIVGLEHLDLSQATSTVSMFRGCEDLTSLDLSSFNTANVENMSFMFDECSSLTSLNLSSFNTANVTSMSYMFSDCSSLTSLNLSSFDTANVTAMSCMFMACTALPALDLSSFNISKVTDMSCMFADDENLVDLNISSFKTTLPVDLGATFKNCASLVELNLENFCIPDTNLGEVELEDTFYGCTSLRKLNIKNIAIGDNEYENMLAKLPSLNTLVLGKYTGLSTVFPSGAPAEDVGLDTEGIWLNVGNGTAIRPEGTEQYTSEQLMAARATIRGSNQRNFTKAETYVRMGLPITVHHVDESGKQIAEDTIFPGNLGDPYSIIGDSVAGYALKADQSPVTGIYDNDEDKEREFTFIYIKIPESSAPIKGEGVLVHYQDEQGRTIAPDEVLNGNIGDGYVSAAKEIAGYTLKTRPKNATGFFSDITQNVTYVYSKTDSNAEGQTDDKDNGNKSNEKKGNKANSATPSRSNRYDAHKNALGNNADSMYSANSSTNNQLPKAGSERKSQLAAIALGLITLTSAVALLWTKIKKFSK